MSIRRRVVVLACVLSLAAAVWFGGSVLLRGDAAVGPQSADASARPGGAENGAPREMTVADVDGPAFSPSREAVVPAGGGDDGADAAEPVFGTVRYRVAVRGLCHAARSVHLRFMNDSRFGDHFGLLEGAVRLSPGVYECAVFVAGCDPGVRAGVEVRAEETTDLGLVAVCAGSGVIEGLVDAPHLGPSEPVLVELYGRGRRPCALCAATFERGWGAEETRCECGFTQLNTVQRLQGGGAFAFGDLAAGTYTLIAMEPNEPYPDVHLVQLEAGERAFVNARLAPEVEVLFVVVTSTGASLVGADGGAQDALRFEFSHNGRRIAEAEVRLGDVVIEEGVSLEAVFESPFPHALRPIDRPREPGDALIPRTPAMWIAPARVRVERQSETTMTLHSLPALPLEAEVRCGRWTSGVFRLDLEAWSGEEVTVVLFEREAAR